jgi:hypothetical protein
LSPTGRSAAEEKVAMALALIFTATSHGRSWSRGRAALSGSKVHKERRPGWLETAVIDGAENGVAR